jgi:O-antigen/teichoic acid export membrane protein
MAVAVKLNSLVTKFLKSRVLMNFSYLTLGNVVSQLLGMIALIKITHIISPAEYGIYTFLLAQGALLVALGDLGVRNINIRTVARDNSKTKDLLYNGVKLRLIVILVLCFLYIVYNHFLGNLDLLKLLILFSYSFVSCIVDLLESITWGYQKMKISTFVNISYSILWLVVIYWLPSFSINFLFVTFFILNCLKLLFFIWLVNKEKLIMGETLPFFISAKRMIKEGMPYFIMIVMMLPTNNLASNFLYINSTPKEIGYFNLAQKLIGPISLVFAVALSALFPNLARMWVEDKIKFMKYMEKGIKFFILLSSFFCFLFSIYAREIVELLFSKAFLPVIKVCQLQVWFFFLMAFNSLLGTIWGAADKEKIMIRTTFINTVITTPLLYWGSYYGAFGLSCAYVSSFTIFGIYLWWKFCWSFKIGIKKDFLAAFILSAILFLLSFYLADKALWIRTLLISGVVCLLFVYYFRKIKLKIL